MLLFLVNHNNSGALCIHYSIAIPFQDKQFRDWLGSRVLGWERSSYVKFRHVKAKDEMPYFENVVISCTRMLWFVIDTLLKNTNLT